MTRRGKRTADFADDTDWKNKSAPSALSAVNSPAPTGRKKIAGAKDLSRRSETKADALGHESPNTSSPEGAKEGGELPEAWVRAPVGELFQVIGGGTPPTSRREFWSGSIPWITSADIGEDHKIRPRRKITKEAILSSA